MNFSIFDHFSWFRPLFALFTPSPWFFLIGVFGTLRTANSAVRRVPYSQFCSEEGPGQWFVVYVWGKWDPDSGLSCMSEESGTRTHATVVHQATHHATVPHTPGTSTSATVHPVPQHGSAYPTVTVRHASSGLHCTYGFHNAGDTSGFHNAGDTSGFHNAGFMAKRLL